VEPNTVTGSVPAAAGLMMNELTGNEVLRKRCWACIGAARSKITHEANNNLIIASVF
jgi:hypothetical protein